jgi:IclR family acetate operon transcriptional repressor
MRAFFRPGRRGPMHASGIGKAILAARPQAEVAGMLGRRALERFTEKTLDTQAALFADLEAIRARGWSLDDEEHTVGMRCIAAAVFNEYGEAVAGLSVSGPAVRLSYERIGELGPKVREAADALTAASGGRRSGTIDDRG